MHWGGERSLSGRREHPSLMCDGVTWGANGSCRVLARWAEGGGGAEGGVSLSAVCGPSVDGVSNMWLLQAWRRCPQEERQGQPSHVLTQSKANYRAAPTVSPVQHSRGPNCASPCAGWLLHLCEVACRDGRGGSFLPLWLLVAPVSHGSWPWPSNCRAASSKVSSLSACQVSASNLPRLKRVCDPTPILPRPPRWDSCAVPSHPWGQGLPTSSGPSCLWLPRPWYVMIRRLVRSLPYPWGCAQGAPTHQVFH